MLKFLKQLVKELGIEGEVVPIERRVGLRHKETLAEFEFGDISTFFKLIVLRYMFIKMFLYHYKLNL